MLDTDDTIVALASATGIGLRGIVRVSGPKAIETVDQIFTSAHQDSPHRAHLAHGKIALREPSGTFDAQCLRWPGDRSYTGQPVAELHLIGVLPILEQVIAELVQAGARLARPGEFTLRAFLAGRMNLAQCEAVLAVIDAQGDGDLRDALNQLAGGLTTSLDEIRHRLLDVLAEIEAGLDFADEDLELIPATRLRTDLEAARRVVDETQSRMGTRYLAGSRPRVALIGYPNAGKSSLLNQLVDQDAAIVSPIAGTTRDWVSIQSQVEGTLIEWIDTAGIEPMTSDKSLSRAAQEATERMLQSADLILICVDSSDARWPLTYDKLKSAVPQHQPSLLVLTKADKIADQGVRCTTTGTLTSSIRREGIEALKNQVVGQLKRDSGKDRMHFVQSTAQRCAASLASAAESLQIALELVGTGCDELLAGELRLALDAIGEVTGKVYTDDVLDRVFSKFCIGK